MNKAEIVRNEGKKKWKKIGIKQTEKWERETNEGEISNKERKNRKMREWKLRNEKEMKKRNKKSMIKEKDRRKSLEWVTENWSVKLCEWRMCEGVEKCLHEKINY